MRFEGELTLLVQFKVLNKLFISYGIENFVAACTYEIYRFWVKCCPHAGYKKPTGGAIMLFRLEEFVFYFSPAVTFFEF